MPLFSHRWVPTGSMVGIVHPEVCAGCTQRCACYIQRIARKREDYAQRAIPKAISQRVTRCLSDRCVLSCGKSGVTQWRKVYHPSHLRGPEVQEGLPPMGYSQTEPHGLSPCTTHRADIGPGVLSVPGWTQERRVCYRAECCMSSLPTLVVWWDGSSPPPLSLPVSLLGILFVRARFSHLSTL